jgi:hypothetical protein
MLVASFFLAISICGSVYAQRSVDAATTAPTLVRAELLTRRYQEGETVSYHMKASNRDRVKTTTYEADASGVVKKDAAGKFVEEFTWANFYFDNKPEALPAAAAFRQYLSLTPGYRLSVPDLRPVLRIVGPITDLLTFYADVQVATQQGSLAKAGDHFYFKHGAPASWADGSYVVVGEDSVDFDVTLTEVNVEDGVATLLVRHVVPAKPEIRIPVEWMRMPVADTPNNWVDVQKRTDGTYSAQVGKEIFDATIRMSLSDGRILGATLENPVEVSERICTDLALTKCAEPIRSQIMRRIEISARL